MRRREACAALFAALPVIAVANDMQAISAQELASRYTATPTPHYVNALLISAQRHLGQSGMARTATAALREAVSAPGFTLPTDWPRLAGYAALAEAATQHGDATAGALAVAALLSTLSESRLTGLRPWTDDMFLATLLVDRTLLLLPERLHATTALATALLDLSARLQRPDGLFDHAESSPVAWGRGNGFASLALSIALAGPLRDTAAPLLARLRAHLHALLPLQREDGLWRQVLDRPEARPELTVTAMSLASLALARRHGWLPAAMLDTAITRAWAGVQSHIDSNGGFRDVCAGTPAGPTLDFYLQRPFIDGRDERAAAMVLLAATTLATRP